MRRSAGTSTSAAVRAGGLTPNTRLIRPPFAGDCLFPGGVGNTQQDAARFASLYEGVVSKVFDRLPDATWVFPGHGGDTTLGAERPHLAEWRARGR